MNAPIPDGTYDAFVVDARTRAETQVLSLTITTGEKKGDVVDVESSEVRDELAIIGLPCTLLVDNGAPRVVFD